MVEEKVRKDVLRSHYSELCNITTFNGSWTSTSRDLNFCKNLQFKPIKEVANHYIDDIIKHIGRGGVSWNSTNIFLSEMWEEVSIIEITSTTTPLTSDDWYSTAGKRKKR